MRRGPDYAEGRFLFVADVLIHEQIHQWVQETPGQEEAQGYHGHGPRFCTKCNEIGAVLGLAPVIAKKRSKGREAPRCAQWPHNVHSPDYYLGAYVPPSGDKAKAVDLEHLARRLRRQLGEDHYRELARLMAADANEKGAR